jgi:hypothetical protein
MDTTISPHITTFLIVLTAIVVLFLIFRELVCWYWKINKISNLLEEIRDELKNKNNSGPFNLFLQGEKNKPQTSTTSQ